jgi:hypothetical protein
MDFILICIYVYLGIRFKAEKGRRVAQGTQFGLGTLAGQGYKYKRIKSPGDFGSTLSFVFCLLSSPSSILRLLFAGLRSPIPLFPLKGAISSIMMTLYTRGNWQRETENK